MSFDPEEFQKALDRFYIDTGYPVRAVEVSLAQWRSIFHYREDHGDPEARDLYSETLPDKTVFYMMVNGVRVYRMGA